MIRKVASNHRCDGAVESFWVPIGLRVIGRRERIVDVQYHENDLKKLSGEASTIVGE